MNSYLTINISLFLLKSLNLILTLCKEMRLNKIILRCLNVILSRVDKIIKPSISSGKNLLDQTDLLQYNDTTEWLSFVSIQNNYYLVAHPEFKNASIQEKNQILSLLFEEWINIQIKEDFEELSWEKKQEIYLNSTILTSKV